MNQLKEMEVQVVADYTAAGTSDVDSSIIDMSDADGVIFIAKVATGASNNYLQASQGADSGLSDAQALEGSKVLMSTTPGVARLCIHRPAERYVRATIKRGTSTTAQSIIAIKYHLRKAPQADPTNYVSKTIVTPDEGTP